MFPLTDLGALMEPGTVWQEGNGMALVSIYYLLHQNFSEVPVEGFGACV